MVSKEEFKKEVWEIAEEIHAKPKQIRIRKMKSKVGSCSPNKIITFSSKVLSLTENLRKEAIVHELLHLRYKNHGKLFSSVLRARVDIILGESDVQYERVDDNRGPTKEHSIWASKVVKK